MYDELYEISKKHAKHTVWVFSDLQQAKFDNAKRCLDICMEDYQMLGNPADMIWYLGDSTESANLEELERMTAMQEEAFASLNIPLCYVTGNHDYDYAQYCFNNQIPDFKMPFYQMVQAHEGWHATENCDDIYYKLPLGNYMVYFISDHVAKDNSWCTTHNHLRYGKTYPYTEEDFAKIRKDMAECGRKVITVSHYAFPGGNRPWETDLNAMIQPLPMNARLHLYGHAHIGEYLCPKERIFNQISWIDWQDIPQVNVSSFENIRGSFCRSVLLQVYENDTLGIFFRNHDAHRFESAFFPAAESAEIPGNFEKRQELASAPWDAEVGWKFTH